MSAHPESFAFGIELELLLMPNEIIKDVLREHGFQGSNNATSAGKDANRLAMCKALVGHLILADIPAQLNTGTYESWTVADEPVLDEVEGYWRCEIVSRILQTTSDWQEEIKTVLLTIRSNFNICLTSECAMHVHISPSEVTTFDTRQLKQIIKGVMYYDRALIKIMPSLHKDNPYCMPNTKYIQKLKTLYDDVSQNSWATAFNACDQSGQLIQSILFAHEFDKPQNCYCFWNFQNITTCGTIEFHGPPGVQMAADANHWVCVTLGFVSNAIVKNWDVVKSTKTYPTSDQLRAAIRFGVQRLGSMCQDALGPMADDNSAPWVASSTERARINAKKAAIGNKKGTFVEKVHFSYPPVGHSSQKV
ncbi:hypothetical protein GX50_05228 [[Emmonsia] crescens]|uniref:Amidoligase enzyme n=1 Tax=[Emmonsia] crescens TaxID=73230 RepID=A0A2B7ZFK5_9EURO|nr:hypothetical protein GX50_05228 [Emmonsia crescens]